MTLRLSLTLLAAVLTFAPAAAAQEPPPAPAEGAVTIKVERAERDRGRTVALTASAWRVRGTLEPYVAGQSVKVRFSRNGQVVKTRTVRVARGPGGTGTFRVAFKSRSAGRMSIVATHAATAELEALRSRALRLRVLAPRVTSPTVVRLLQRGLARLHYVVPRSGRYDAGTQRAVMAWRKVTGAARSFAASAAVIRGVTAGRGTFKVRHPRDGRHIEADLSRQVLALIDKGRVQRIYHTSSGAPATPTILGRYRVYRKDLGVNSLGMVDSSYFIRGYAIHGYASVPAFNASHGCLRVPVPDARSIYNWIRMGTVVRVYP